MQPRHLQKEADEPNPTRTNLDKHHMEHGYPLKVGQCITSTPEPDSTLALPRSGPCSHVREYRFTEVGKRPPDKAGGGRRLIQGSTSKVVPHRPHLVAWRWQSALVMRPLCERAIAAFDGRRGPLQGAHALASPCRPRLQGLEGQPLGEPGVVNRRLARVQRWAQRGLPPGTTCVRHVVGPIDAWEEILLGPYPPARRPSWVRHILLNPCPSTGHEGRQGGPLLAPLGPHGVTGRELVTGGHRFSGRNRRGQPSCALRRRVWGGVVETAGREGDRAFWGRFLKNDGTTASKR